MKKFYCTHCFYIHRGETAPEECIVCGRSKEYFSEMIEQRKQYIPKYWAETLEAKIARIHKLQEQAGADSTSFGMVTDLHWAINAHHSAALMEEITKRCDIPYFFNGGDTVSGAGLCEAKTIIEDLDNYRQAFSSIEHKCLLVEGNHDTAYSTLGGKHYYDENITKDVFFDHYFKTETLYPNRVFGREKNYYYADDAAHKMRYVVLNTHDVPSEETDESHRPIYNKFRMCAVRQEQMEWFANIALDVPDREWTVVLATHENPTTKSGMFGQELILGLLDAFRKHKKYEGKTSLGMPEYEVEISADYAGCGGNFAVWVSGHTHVDRVVNVDGINCTCTLDDALHKSENSPFERVRGTDSEHAIDIFTVDKRQKKIFITRVGAGEDRVLDYEVF